jgi:hypothetical protein
MYILLSSYTFPTDAEATENAVAYVSYIGADVWDGSSGRVDLWLYRSFELANVSPSLTAADKFIVRCGEIMVHAVAAQPDASPPIEAVEEVRFPDVLTIDAEAAQVIAANPSLSPMRAIGAVIYSHLVNHPRLVGASLVTS